MKDNWKMVVYFFALGCVVGAFLVGVMGLREYIQKEIKKEIRIQKVICGYD